MHDLDLNCLWRWLTRCLSNIASRKEHVPIEVWMISYATAFNRSSSAWNHVPKSIVNLFSQVAQGHWYCVSNARVWVIGDVYSLPKVHAQAMGGGGFKHGLSKVLFLFYNACTPSTSYTINFNKRRIIMHAELGKFTATASWCRLCMVQTHMMQFHAR